MRSKVKGHRPDGVVRTAARVRVRVHVLSGGARVRTEALRARGWRRAAQSARHREELERPQLRLDPDEPPEPRRAGPGPAPGEPRRQARVCARPAAPRVPPVDASL
ncbi:hypothetical protein EYF80_040560 [Liparis tanakae]|uniref:Uncharacterized protein n=1 Tax=Liparis tanakae TaxID=230148 RepID=A0A4Z2G803_9TELE|nr:hypothetical protein EYF80_040560 [Liparis tanakae]